MLWGVPPSPIFGDNSFRISNLRQVGVCKYVITKGLQLNLGKQKSYSRRAGCFPGASFISDLYI